MNNLKIDTLLRTLSFDAPNSNVGGLTRAQLDSVLGISNSSGYSAFAWNYSNGGGELDLFVNRNGEFSPFFRKLKSIK